MIGDIYQISTKDTDESYLYCTELVTGCPRRAFCKPDHRNNVMQYPPPHILAVRRAWGDLARRYCAATIRALKRGNSADAHRLAVRGLYCNLRASNDDQTAEGFSVWVAH